MLFGINLFNQQNYFFNFSNKSFKYLGYKKTYITYYNNKKVVDIKFLFNSNYKTEELDYDKCNNIKKQNLQDIKIPKELYERMYNIKLI